MATFFTVLLSVLLILDCLFLTLLVLVQLPKKDAGAGMAFGGGAADALFGAGSGNALTKLTRNSAIIFFVLVLVLCVLDKNRGSSGVLRNAMQSTSAETSPTTAPATAVPAASPLPAASSNAGVQLTIGSNSPPATTLAPALTSPSTNTPPK